MTRRSCATVPCSRRRYSLPGAQSGLRPSYPREYPRLLPNSEIVGRVSRRPVRTRDSCRATTHTLPAIFQPSKVVARSLHKRAVRCAADLATVRAMTIVDDEDELFVDLEFHS